jgi:DNA-binding transcriptional regulator YiaG
LDRRKLAARLGVDVKSALNWESGRTLPVSRLRHHLSQLAPEHFRRYEFGWNKT